MQSDILAKATAPKIIYRGIEIKYAEGLDRYWISNTRRLYMTPEQAMEDINNITQKGR